MIPDLSTWQLILMIVDYTIKFAVIGVIPENRKPSSANAWLLVILLIPFLGLPLYFFFGSTYLSRRRHRIQKEAHNDNFKLTRWHALVSGEQTVGSLFTERAAQPQRIKTER